MCRHNQLWGCILVAFGLGLLVGSWLERGFICSCLACGLAIFGLGIMRK